MNSHHERRTLRCPVPPSVAWLLMNIWRAAGVCTQAYWDGQLLRLDVPVMKMLKRQVRQFTGSSSLGVISITVVFQSSQPVNVRWMRLDAANHDARTMIPVAGVCLSAYCETFMMVITENCTGRRELLISLSFHEKYANYSTPAFLVASRAQQTRWLPHCAARYCRETARRCWIHKAWCQ